MRYTKLTILLLLFFFTSKTANAAITLRPPLNLGLVGYWSMDEGTGTKAGDMSGNGKTGTIYSTATETFTTSGSGSWTAPAGVASVQVEAWGGGGNGASYIPPTGGGGGGGGGGAYAKKNSYSVTPGNGYSYYVGGATTDSYFINSSTVLAKAGSSAISATGGQAGQAGSSIGDSTTSGFNGENGSWDDHCGGIFGGAGGNGATASGGIGGEGSYTGDELCSGGWSASAGTQPGGGGGGDTGASGAPGQIVLTYSNGTDPTWTTGKRGQALSFNGTGDYVSVGNVGSGIKTISFWLKADDTTSRKIMDFDGTDRIELNGSSQITATSFPGTTIIYVDGAVASTIDTNWHFVTITDTTGVNGSAVDIGRVASNYFDGMIDEMRMYSGVLTPTEVSALYASGAIKYSTPNNTGLVGYWSFEEGTGTKAGDFSGNGKTGTIYSNITETLTTPGSGSWQAPAGITSVQVEVWGGGGSGYTSGSASGGGGGAAYAKKNSLSVSNPTSYDYFIGSATQASWFKDSGGTKVCEAVGGSNGTQNSGGAGGADSSSTGDVRTSGLSGTEPPGINSNGGDGGAAGGTAGGSGGSWEIEPAVPGGGGSGYWEPYDIWPDQGAQTGAPGEIILTYAGAGATWTDGKRGNALGFNGSGDYISAGNVGSGIKTISFWLKADDTTTRKIIDFDGTDRVELNGSSQITATSFPGTTIIYVDGAVASTIDTNWHFVTITDTTGVNGSAVDIGRVASNYFDGMIDEVRFYNRVLGATEVAALYNSSGKGVKINSSQNDKLTSGMVGLWSFNGPDVNITTNTAYDRAGSNNGTISGATPAIGKVGQGMSLNGSSNYVSTGLNIDQSSGHTATFCAWVNPASTSASYHSVISTDNGGSDWTLERNGAYWGVMEGNGHWASNFSADTNEWQHICVVFDTNNVYFYKNASSQAKGTAPGVSTTTSLSIDVSAGADDGSLQSSVSWSYSGDNPYLGYRSFWDEYSEGWIEEGWDNAFRFLNVTIPKDATISSATLRLYASDEFADPASILISGVDEDNTATFTTNPFARAQTTASENDSVGYGWYTSVNLKDIVSEITSRAGWSSGNALGLLLLNVGGSQGYEPLVNVYHYELSGTTYDPQLDINYGGPNNISIGRNPTGSEYFDGKIDEVRVYNRELSAGEVGQLYDMGR